MFNNTISDLEGSSVAGDLLLSSSPRSTIIRCSRLGEVHCANVDIQKNGYKDYLKRAKDIYFDDFDKKFINPAEFNLPAFLFVLNIVFNEEIGDFFQMILKDEDDRNFIFCKPICRMLLCQHYDKDSLISS